MSTECGKCSDKISNEDISILCSNFNICLHFLCAGYSEASFKRLTNNKKKSLNNINVLILVILQKLKQIWLVTFHLLLITSVTKLDELVKSVNFMGNQFDDFSKKIDFVLKEIKDLKTENQKILTENKYLNEEIITMKQKIDDLEQFNVVNSVEIKGIPKTTNENCTDIVQAISKKN